MGAPFWFNRLQCRAARATPRAAAKAKAALTKLFKRTQRDTKTLTRALEAGEPVDAE